MKFYLSLLFFTITVFLLPGFIKAAALLNPSRQDFSPSFLENKRGMGLRLPHLLRLQDSGNHHYPHGMDKRRLVINLGFLKLSILFIMETSDKKKLLTWLYMVKKKGNKKLKKD
uniref:Uncharacterized protein n=1 Tax=Panagrolaimus sp. ES5 TaxID=591445 RepID=A0AC34GTW4_9BILA